VSGVRKGARSGPDKQGNHNDQSFKYTPYIHIATFLLVTIITLTSTA